MSLPHAPDRDRDPPDYQPPLGTLRAFEWLMEELIEVIGDGEGNDNMAWTFDQMGERLYDRRKELRDRMRQRLERRRRG